MSTLDITTKEFDIKVKQTIYEWETEGEDGFLDGNGQMIPKYPGYVFRLLGEWKGWAEIDSSDPDNFLMDAIEDEAWKRINQ